MTPYYERNGIVIYHGDCLEMLEKVSGDSVGLVVMDPPYSSGTRQTANRTASAIPKRGERWSRAGITWDSSYSSFGLSMLFNHALHRLKHTMRDGAHLYSFIDWRHYPLLSLSIEAAGLFLNNLLVWDKEVYALGTNYRSQYELIAFASKGPADSLPAHDIGNVLRTPRLAGAVHPTQKPVPLLHRLLEYGSPGTLLDPFMGVGTALVAAQNLGRRAIGIEIEERYCEIAAKRLAQDVLPLEVAG